MIIKTPPGSTWPLRLLLALMSLLTIHSKVRMITSLKLTIRLHRLVQVTYSQLSMHVLDFEDELSRDFLCHVAHSYPEQEHKSTGRLSYLKLDDLKQLCLQNACKFTFFL